MGSAIMPSLKYIQRELNTIIILIPIFFPIIVDIGVVVGVLLKMNAIDRIGHKGQGNSVGEIASQRTQRGKAATNLNMEIMKSGRTLFPCPLCTRSPREFLTANER